MALKVVARLTLVCLAVLATPSIAKSVDLEIRAGTNPDGSMYFHPDTFTVEEGDEVTITAYNEDSIFHDLAILDYDGRDIEFEQDPRETVTKSFIATVPGTFDFICEVRGHKEKGMAGTFTVTPTEDTGAVDVPGPAALPLAALVVGVALAIGRRPRRPRWSTFPLVAAVMLAGCAAPEAAPGEPFEDDFDATETMLPPGWTVSAGTWELVDDERAPSQPHALQATNVGEGYPLILAPTGTYGDLDASVRFLIEGGSDGQAAGIAYHVRDAANYDVVRINLLEGNVKLFTYQEGDRRKLADGPADAFLGSWYVLNISVRGPTVTAWLDGTEVLVAEEPVNDAGGIGLWTKDDSTTLFDEFVVRPVAA